MANRTIKNMGGGPDLEVKDLEIASALERFNEYELVDGTKIRLKAVLTSLSEVVGQRNPDGTPLYIGQITPVIVAVPK